MAIARPLREAPAFDGMDLEAPLLAVWGSVPVDATISKLKGDASTRSYYRVASGSAVPTSLVVMRLPEEPNTSSAGLDLPFLNVHRHLERVGLPVPRVYVDATSRGVVLLEDLGDETFASRLEQRPRGEWPALYGAAVDLMASLHTRAAEPVSDCIAYQRAFDRKLLRWELDHFREWGLEALDVELSQATRSELDALFDELVERLLALPQGFVHRDFQSRNLMWAPRSPASELVLIDFQDALRGPAVYDLVALLCDSYVRLDEPLQQAMIARLARIRGTPASELEHAFWLVAVQRKLKDAGRFVFIDQVRGNPDFLPWFGPSLGYVGRALEHLPELAPLRRILESHVPGFPYDVPVPPARTGRRST